MTKQIQMILAKLLKKTEIENFYSGFSLFLNLWLNCYNNQIILIFFIIDKIYLGLYLKYFFFNLRFFDFFPLFFIRIEKFLLINFLFF